MIDTDASAYQLGATLLQQQDPSKPKEWVPVFDQYSTEY